MFKNKCTTPDNKTRVPWESYFRPPRSLSNTNNKWNPYSHATINSSDILSLRKINTEDDFDQWGTRPLKPHNEVTNPLHPPPQIGYLVKCDNKATRNSPLQHIECTWIRVKINRFSLRLVTKHQNEPNHRNGTDRHRLHHR